jgi:predicted GTPase
MSPEYHVQHCMDTVGNELDGRRPLNIAVIGPPGCGKSSFLNTTFASFKNNDSAMLRMDYEYMLVTI